MEKIKYKPNRDCCNHYSTDLFTVGYLANKITMKPSRFKVYICDNCDEAHLPYKGLKQILAILYFKIISQGLIFIPFDDEEDNL